MSDTPRTDAMVCPDGWIVDANDVYAMERELAAMTARAEKAERVSMSVSTDMVEIAAERDEARAEALEQARLNGMGSEREARLMAQVQEARAELARLKDAIPVVLTHIDDIGARGYYSGRTLEGDAAIEVLRAALKGKT
jgi:hypothetical protein